MSIEYYRDIGKFVPTCDYCGDELDARTFWSDAVADKKASGWKSYKDDDTGEWTDMCPACQRFMRQKKATRNTAQQDFEGII